MPKIIVKNLGQKTVLFAGPASLLTILQNNQIDWMHACGGKGRCTTCAANILSGAEGLPPMNAVEGKYAKGGQLKTGQRLACQVVCSVDIEISVPKAYKLPHISYSD